MNTTNTTNRFWLPVWTLAVREVVRFLRQKTRLIGAFGQPVIFWVLFGSGFQSTFRPPAWAPADLTYQEYFFPGVALLIVMFTAIFSTISIIEDRNAGFLQGVLVAPVSRAAIVFGKLTGGTILAVFQAALFLAIGPLLSVVNLSPAIKLQLAVGDYFLLLGFLIVISFSLTALGFAIAWPLDSTQGFHAIMSVLLMPLWLLSGAIFPATGEGWLSWMIRFNPLSYELAGLRRIMNPELSGVPSSDLPGMVWCVLVTVGFCSMMVAVDLFLMTRSRIKNVR